MSLSTKFNVENTVPEAFLQRAGKQGHPIDAVIIVLLPTILCFVYLFPESIRQSLVFDYTDPSLRTAFSSAFIHLDLTHLIVNVVTYALVVPVVYLLNIMSERRSLFYSTFLTFSFIFPVVLAYLNLAIFRPSAAFGFSGIVMAFVGFLPIALADFLETNFDIGPGKAIAPMLFFLGIALISVLSVRSIIPENKTVLLGNSALALVALLSAVLYALSVYKEESVFRSKFRHAVDTAGYVELAAISLVLFFAFPFVAFPSNVTIGGSQLNLYVHLLGYSLGFIIVYTQQWCRPAAGRQSPVHA